jgi:hypothetical protein
MPSCVPLVSIVPAVRPLACAVQRPSASAAPQSLACTVQRSFDVPSEDGQSWSADHVEQPRAIARGLRRSNDMPFDLPVPPGGTWPPRERGGNEWTSELAPGSNSI